MSSRWLIAGALASLIAAPAAAQDASELADRFERALVAGDYRDLPLAEDFTYTENGARLDPWDGMWRTTTALTGATDHPELDFYVQLQEGDKLVRIVESLENTVHGVLAYQLIARDGLIQRIDALPIREEFGGDRGGTLTLLQPMLAMTMEGEHVVPLDAAFAAPGMVEMPRAEAAIARYLGDPQAAGEPLAFADDCVRTDNGRRVTDLPDAPLLDPAHPEFRPYALSCRDQFASGFHANFVLGNYSGMGAEDRGMALVFARLDQPGTALSFTTPDGIEIAYPGPRGEVAGADTGEQFDGRILTNMITPMSVNGVFLFKFDETGAISRIASFYRGAPLGWDAVPD